MLSHFSHIQLFATPWIVAHQAPLSIGFPMLEYWTRLPCANPGIEPTSLTSPALIGGFFTTSANWEALERTIMDVKTIRNMVDWKTGNLQGNTKLIYILASI